MRAQKLLYVTILLILAFGCSESVDPKPYTYSRVFSGKGSKTWRIDRLTFKKQGQSDEVIPLSTCEKDDLYTFFSNEEKLFEVDNGGVDCSGDEADQLLVSYTWNFNQATASLSMVTPHIFGYYYIPFTVNSASERQFELQLYIDLENTMRYVLLFKLVDEG